MNDLAGGILCLLLGLSQPIGPCIWGSCSERLYVQNGFRGALQNPAPSFHGCHFGFSLLMGEIWHAAPGFEQENAKFLPSVKPRLSLVCAYVGLRVKQSSQALDRGHEHALFRRVHPKWHLGCPRSMQTLEQPWAFLVELPLLEDNS